MSKGKKIGKSIQEMIDEIRKTLGSYEAKRLERAADEVPNLERLYQREALEGLFRGDNAKGIMTMRPGDFERYAAPLDYSPTEPKTFMFGELAESKGQAPKGITQEEYLRYLANLGGFETVPYLEVNAVKQPRKKPELAVTGHEGRHRSRALEMSGQPSSLVQFLPRAGLREPFPRRSREEYIQALNEEMSRYANMVRPQQEGPDRRPLIKLPDVYKQGGPVHKQDGGSIKASPAKPGQQFLGRLGQVAEKLGIKLEEAMKIVSQEGNSPVKAFITNMLVSEPLKSAGTALQDWTGTPRDATEDYPYRRLMTGKGMTAQFDPRLLDVAPIAGTAASRVAYGIKNLPTDVMRAATAAYGPRATASHIFIGAKSPLWKASQAEKAVELEKAGVSPVDIWKQTGTFRSPDGALRQEISDKKSKLTDIAKSSFTPGTIKIKSQNDKFNKGLSDALIHDELKKAYPDLFENLSVKESPKLEGGSFYSREHILDPNRKVGIIEVSESGNDPRSTMIHEIQHAIQEKEGFGSGGSPENMAQVLDDQKIDDYYKKDDLLMAQFEKFKSQWQGKETPEDIAKQVMSLREEIDSNRRSANRFIEGRRAFGDTQYSKQELNDAYRRLAGEAEARAAQARIDLTPEQRLENFPLEAGTQYGYDVKPEDIIVKRKKKGGQVSIDAMRLAVQNKAKGGAATSNEAMLRRAKRLGKVDRPVSISPLQLARGWAAGTAGLPGDIESLVRVLVPGMNEETFLPTSEDLLKKIPGAATDEIGQRAAEIGTLFGGAGTALGGKLAAKGAKAIAPKIGETAEEYMFRAGMALPAVPPSRSIEEATKLFEAAQKTRSRAAQEAAGLYHPIGGGVKLSQPVELMTSKTVADPSVKPVKRRIITPEDMQGGIALPLIGDRAAAGRILTEVGGQRLSKPVNLQGGPGFMQTHTLPDDESAAWASGQGVISRLSGLAQKAAELGGTDKIYAPYVAMSPTGVDFNAMVAQTVLNQYDPSALTKKAKKEFLNDVRNYVPNKKKPHIKPGSVLTEADLNDVEALREKMLSPDAGPLRKVFVQRMGTNKFQNQGFPNVAAARAATTEPELMDIDVGSTGHNIALINPEGKIIESPKIPHETYPVQLSGEYFGSLEQPVSYKEFFPGYVEARRALGKPEKDDWYTFGRSMPLQQLDQEWLDRIMKARQKPREWKKGGAVKKAEGGQITADDLIVEERPL